MPIGIKHIALTLFLIDALLLIINIEYQDQIVSVNHDLDSAKIWFYLGTLSFILSLILNKSKEIVPLASIIVISFLCISVSFNLRLAKINYDRIECNNGISEYFEYFEFDSCEKIKKRFEVDLINGELKYFQNTYDSELEFEERLRDNHGIELIGTSCTQFTSMACYNNLVKDYLKNKKRLDN